MIVPMGALLAISHYALWPERSHTPGVRGGGEGGRGMGMGVGATVWCSLSYRGVLRRGRDHPLSLYPSPTLYLSLASG